MIWLFHIFILNRNIFLGETFSSYISVHNDGNQIVKDILVKVLFRTKSFQHVLHNFHSLFTHNCPVMWPDPLQADLQTSSQRLNLSASNSAVAELKPECCIDDVIHHEVKEIGTHMWVFLLFAFSEFVFPTDHIREQIFTTIKSLLTVWLLMFISSFPISSLVCAVSYTTQHGEKLYFRKFFKFQVSYICESSLDGGGKLMC